MITKRLQSLKYAQTYYESIFSGNIKRKDPRIHDDIMNQFENAKRALGKLGASGKRKLAPDSNGFFSAIKNHQNQDHKRLHILLSNREEDPLKGITIIIISIGMLIAPVVSPQGAWAEDDEFTFGDVFVQKSSEEKVTFHGYVAFQYFDSEGAQPGGNRSFDQHIFEPFFGYQVNDHVFAKLIFELEHSPEKQGTGQYVELFIEQAEIDIIPREGTSIGFGAILVPFGLENYLHAPSDIRLITRPPIAKSGANGSPVLNNTWTDVGIQLTQDISQWGTLDLYVINGSALQTKSTRGRDTKGANANEGKSFGAEIQITEVFPGLNFGASYVTGTHDTADKLDSSRIGVHAVADLKTVHVTAEYVMGTDEGTGTVTTDADLAGYYVTVSLTPPISGLEDRLDVSVRYTDWTVDDDAKNDFSERAYGIRYRLYENTWAKIEHQMNSEDGTNPEVDNDKFGLQLNVLF